MARITADYFSSSLMRTTTLDVILPFDGQDDAWAADSAFRREPELGDATPDRSPYPARKAPFKALFLLHGLTGNHANWISETRIQAWAEERGLAVVMPSGYNAFYLDQPETHNYYSRFVGQELVAVARSMFPLSSRREDTFIGGISMGGYGALRCGISAAMIVDGFEGLIRDEPFFMSRPFLESTFGDLSQIVGSDKDPARLAADLVYCDRPRPRVFIACGNQDPFCEPDRVLADRLRSTGLDVTHIQQDGGHDWDFWGRMLPQALDWLG